jgi:S1-C subfamily serine protease
MTLAAAIGSRIVARVGHRRLAALAAGLSLTLLGAAAALPARAQLTTNVYNRVLLIRVGNETGTGFTLDVDGRQYLITAKHVVGALGAQGTLMIYKNKGWQAVPMTIFRCEDPVDIAVLVPPAQLTVNAPLEPTTKKLRYGDDVYFAGFPYGLRSNAQELSGGYPVAFVKKAVMSGEVSEHGASMLVLDGHNNPGFSGGPLIYRDVERPGFAYDVAGVVKGFRADLAPVYRREEVTPDQITAEDLAKDRIVRTNKGRTLRLTDTGEVVKLNSDLLIAYNISYAIALIRKNPIGPVSLASFQP